jgi:hypothetical protein
LSRAVFSCVFLLCPYSPQVLMCSLLVGGSCVPERVSAVAHALLEAYVVQDRDSRAKVWIE